VFLVPAPLAALLVVAGLRILDTPDPPLAADRHYDLPGAITVTASMVALVYSVVEAPTRGWADSRTIGGLAISAGLLAAFVAIEKRSAAPLIRLGILRVRTLVSADVAAMLYFGSYLGFQFLATLYVQDVAGWSPIDTALAFLPSGAFLPILGAQAPRIIGRFGTQKLIAAALIAFAAGYALFLRADSVHLNYVTMLLPSMIVIGIGWGLGFPALNVQATEGIEGTEQGLAAGLFNTSFQIGGAIVLAVVSAVLSSHLSGGGSRAHAILDSLHPALAILIPVALAGVVVIVALSPRRRVAAVNTASEAELEATALAEGAESL
jgi:Na+/melibiose symporter-like transporter